MDGLSTTKAVLTSQLTSVPTDGASKTDCLGRRPVLLPGCFGMSQGPGGQSFEAASGGQSSANLGVGKSARQGQIAGVPQSHCKIAALLLNQQLHERAAVEVDKRHESAALFAHQIGHRSARLDPSHRAGFGASRQNRLGENSIPRELID